MFHMGQPDNLGKDLNLTAAQLGRNGGGGEGLSAVIKLVMTYFVNAGGDFLTLRAFFKRIMRGQVFFFFAKT